MNDETMIYPSPSQYANYVAWALRSQYEPISWEQYKEERAYSIRQYGKAVWS